MPSQNKSDLPQKVMGSLLVVLAVAAGARVASMMLDPIIPWLFTAFALVAVYWVLASWWRH